MSPRVVQWAGSSSNASQLLFHVVVLDKTVVVWVGTSPDSRLGEVSAALPTPFSAIPSATTLLADSAASSSAQGEDQQDLFQGFGQFSQGNQSTGPSVTGGAAVATRLAKRTGLHFVVMGPVWESTGGRSTLEGGTTAGDGLAFLAERELIAGLRDTVIPEAFKRKT